MIFLEFLSVNDRSFGQLGYFSSFLGLQSFGMEITSVNHKLEIILVRFDQTVVNVGLRIRESAATQQLWILFVVSSKR